MTVRAGVLASSRQNGLASLRFSGSTVSGALEDNWQLPTGYGDVLILECNIYLTGVTRAAIATNVGPRVGIYTGGYVDHLDAEPWVLPLASELQARLRADNPILWRQNEDAIAAWAAVESAGSYTYNALVKVRPLRNVGPSQ